MKIAQLGAFVATVASLSTFTYGYSFSDVSTTTEAEKESTGLTSNEENRIYGGSEANIDKYPFLVSLRDPFFDETFCGGALIAPQYILTAGHCIKTDEMDIVATFGTNDSTGSGSGEATTIPIIAGFRHPLYKKKEHLYDVGLLKLKKPIKRKTAKLCAADGSDNKVGTLATVLGWGKTEDSSDMQSPTLEELTIPVISNAECGKFKKYVGRVTEGMLCAGTGNGRDTCNGDSGGPLLVDGSILIGCVSWGSKCGQQAGIFTRLTYVMDYIEDILAGGDGSKFNVTSSSSGSEEVSLPSSSDGSSPDATKVPSAKATKAPVEDSSESTSESASQETETPATKNKLTQGEDSASGSADLSSLLDNMSWLLNQLNGSGSDDLSMLFLGSDSGSGSADDTILVKVPVADDDSESGSDDLSWLLDSESDSGSDGPILVKGKTTAKSGSHDLDWLFASDSDSGSEDAVLVKGGKVTKASKAAKASKSSTEEYSASTSASSSGSEESAHQSDLAHQSEKVTQQSLK